MEKDEYAAITLLWLLVLHYEIGYKMVAGVTLETAVLTLKRTLLTWINGVLPNQNITNFNTHWKDGRMLSALINYCQPGLIQDHASLKASNAAQNVQKAIAIAKSQLGVESFMATEEFVLEKPDEISMMMYLAQFCTPGQRILLLWIQQQIPDEKVTNFSDSWVSGKALGALTNAISGGRFPGYAEMTSNNALANIEQSMVAAEKMLGVRRTITPAMFSEVQLDELFRLSYLAQFQSAKESRDSLMTVVAAADKVEVSNLQIPNAIGEGKSVWVELDCSDAGYGEVKAEVRGRKAGNVPTTVKEVEGDGRLGSDKYRVSFVPPSVDVYDFMIRYGGEHVIGSPFSVNLYPPDPEKVQHTGTTDNSDTGQDVALNFETKEAGRGKLSAKAEGEISGNLPIKITPLGDGTFAVNFHPQFPDIYTVDVFWGKFSAHAVGETSGPVALQVNQDKKSDYCVCFKPPNPDIYMVDVSWDGKPVPGSPFIVDLLPPPMPEEVECAVPIYNEPGEEAELLVDASNAGKGKIKASCTGEHVGDVPTDLSKVAGRTYQVTFTPPENDLYTLDVLFDNKHVKGSPFKIDMRPGVEREYGEIHETAMLETPPDATKCILHDAPKPGRVVYTGKPVSFSVDCRNAGPGELEVSAEGAGVRENPPDITVNPHPHTKGVYDITFIAKVSSPYILNLTWFNDPIPNTPLHVSAVDPAAIIHVHYGKPVSVDCEAEGKSGDFKAIAIHDETDAQYKVKVTKPHKNKYRLSFSPRDSGLYRVHVRMKDKEIRESPFIINYGKPPKPEACRVEGLTLKCYIRELTRFTVDVTEAGSGDLVIKPVGPKKDKSELTVIDNKNGTFSVEYTPQTLGDHNFHITWAGKNIPGSPFLVPATERTPDIVTDVYLLEDYSKSTQSQKAVPPSEETIKSLLGNPLLLRVIVSDELKDEEFTATATGRDTGLTDVTVTKINSNEHEVLLNPNVQDLFTVSAKVGDEQVPRSPVEVKYSAPISDPSKCRITDLPSTLYVNKIISFKVHTEDAGPGDLKVTVNAPQMDEPPAVDVKQSPIDSVYQISYTPKSPGQHSLSIMWAGYPIPDTPIQWNVSEPPTYGYGQQVGMDISVDCKPGELEAHAVHVDTDTPYNVEISKIHKGKYKLTLQPRDPGYYHIHVLLKKNEIPASPFVVKYGQPSRPDKCTVRDQPEYVYVNRPIHFVVDAKEAGSGELSIKASVPEREQDVSRPELKIEDNKDGTFGVDYVPNRIGKHSFDILWSGQVIPDSPVNVDVRDEGMNLSGLIEDFIPKDLPEPKPLIIEERIDAVPATEVEGGNPAALPVPEEPPITVDRRPNPITIIVGKALKLKVKPKDETQRQGTLKARAQGETTGPGVVKTSQHDDGVFEVYFNPPQPDYYVVDVKLNNENVPQSPFHVLYLPPPEKEPTVEGPAKEEIQAVFVPDKPIDYNIDLSGVPSGTLSAKCRGEESGPVPVTYEPIAPGSKKYKVTFVPPQPDLYHLSVFFNGKELTSSPYEIDLRRKIEDLEPAVEGPAREEIQAEFVPDKPIDYSIDLSSFPSGNLTAKCQGEESGPVPVTYEPIGPDSKKYRVAFVPPQPDLYHLSVFFNDREVKGSPYEIDLRRKVEESIDSAHIQRAIEVYTAPGDDQFTPADKEGTPISDTSEHAHTVEDVPTEEFTVVIGTPLVVKVHAKTDEQRNGELTGTAIGDSVGHRDISAFKRDDTHIVRFDPTEPDRYTIDVKINDESVPRSPFRVNYIMPPTDATKCKLIGVKAIGDFVEVGKDVNLQVDAKQAGPGNLEVSAERPAEEEVASMLSATPSQKEWGYYDVDYIPQSHGKHSLTLKWADQTIPQSPVEIMAVDPNKTEVVPNGKQASVDIDADGHLKAHCIHKETNHSYKVKINKLQKGKFRLTFQPKDIGIYFLHVYIKDKEIPQSPYIIRYARPAKPEACKVTGLTDRCYLGETVTFKVDTKEAGDGGLKIKTLGPDGKETEGLQLTDDKDGIYSAELTPAVPGMYELQMMWGGKPVPGQPFPLFVRDLSKEELLVWLFDIDRVGDLHSVNFPAEGEVLQDATDHTMLLRVQARTEEQKKEQLTVTATNEETSEKTSFTVTKQGDDTFEARFIPTVPQTYTIEAQLGSSPVPHTPFKVHYETPKADAGKCVIVGLEKHPDKFQTNKPILFQVDTRLAGNGKLNLKAEGVQVKPILEAKASKEDSRIIDVTYTPTAPGTHHVQVLWSGEPVPKSPLTFPVEAIPRFPHGKHIGYDLAVDAKAGDIEAHVIHEDTNSRLKVKISKVSKGKYHFSFSPKKPGLYALHILVKKKDIKQSPIYFLYEGPPNPEACLVKDVPEEWYIHEQGSFTVDATEAGTASLSAKVTPPTRGKGGDIKVINNDDGTYTVEHTPEVLGSHKIALTWAGKAIPNSPVTTSVKKRVPKAKAGLGPYMNIVPVGDRVEVDVVNLDKYASDRKYVTASVRAKVGTDQPEIEYKEGTCAVSFVPTVADDYSLSVKISEEEIDGSPFLIKSVDRPCLTKDYAPTEDICSSDVEAGRDVCLVIPKDDSLPHGSEPQVEVRGPEGPCEMKLIDQVESSYGLNFTPSVPGDYLIHVRKDKDSEAEIESSPYKIRAIEKQPDSLRVTVPDDFQPLFANPAPLYCLLRFDINTANAGYGTLKIRQSGEGKATISVTQKNEHIYTCNLIPTRKGSCQIDITWNDEGIRGSPFHLTFIPTPTDRTPDINTDIYLVENYNKPTQSQKAVPPSEETVESVIGNAVLVKVTVSDELKDREFSATAVGKDTGPTNVKVTKVNSNVHEVLLYPDKQDVYTVTAKSGDIEVPRSPFVVKYDEPSRPDKCTVHDQPEYVYVNHPIHFVVDAKEAGSGALSIKASVPESEQDVSRPELKIEDNKDGTFGVDYIPSTIGKHSFDILWSGQVIPDSPVNVDVRDEGMNLSGLIEDFIPKDLPVPVEEIQEEVQATEVEGGNPAVFPLPVPEEPPISVERRPNPITIIVGKALKLKVKPKDETQRQGTLKARVQGETTGPGVVKTSQHDDGVFEVYFNPPQPDYYVVDVKLNNENVPQSPFHVLYLPAPEEEPTVEGPAKEEIQAVFVPDKPIDYNIDLSGVSSGTLSARCRGEESGPVPVTCEPISPDSKKYRVTFVPPRPDLYHLSVFFNDKEMKGSPYEIDLRKKVEDLEPAVEGPAREEIQAEFVPDKPIDYSIDLSSFPSGNLTAKCQGEESGPVPVIYEPISPDSKKYLVAFVPPQPDLYHLSVFFNDREVKGSPYEIDLRRKVEEPVDTAHIQRAIEVYTAPGDDQFTPADKEGTPISDTSEHAHTVEDVPTEEFTVFIGTPLVVKVHAKTDEQRNGELTGTAIGDSVGHRDISAFKRDDTHIVRFDPTEPDRYTIDVKINDESVPRSPFRVNYIMPPTDATKCKLIGVKAIGDFVEVGKNVNLQVDAKQAGPGNLEVSAERPAEEEVASMLSATPSQKEWGYYDVDYIPQSHGKHSLTLKWADQTIPQSPVEIMAVDPNKTEVVPNGKQASVDIDADGHLKAHCIHKETNHSYKVKINKLQKGKFRLTFQPKDIGIYFLHVYIKDKELPQSPFIIRYARPAKPEACKVTGLTDRCYLGETVTFKVDTKEAGDGGLKIKTLGPDGKETEGLQLTDDKDGIYSAELTPAVPGMYELQMMWGGKPVPDQPFPLFVRDLSKEELLVWLFDIDRVGDLHSVNFPAEGEVLQDATDHTMLLRVQARTEEQKKEQLTVTATNEETSEKTSFTVTKQGDDTFEARFIPTVPQTYTIEAQLGSSPVPHTPFKVHYETPKADAGKCVIVGLEKHPDKFQTNKPILFQVDTRLAGNGKLNLKAEGVQVKPILEAKASKEDSRIIDVTYTPTAPGTHHVQVLWSGEPVPKSPLTFPVEAIPRFPHGKHIGYDLAVDAKAGDIEAHVIHEDTNSRLKVKISKVSKGKYHFSFSPKKPGLYALHILVKKKDIKQSPIYFLYEGPPNPEACLVKDVPEEWYIHEQGSFTVDATEAGTASLSAKVTPPTRGKGGDIKVINNDDGTYTVEHTPEVLGSHKIALTWAGKAIPNSPVTTSVKKRVPKAKAGLGPYMNIVPVGDRVEVDVVNLDKYASDRKYVTASVRAKVGTDQPEIEYKEGTCAVSFVPTVADDYSLSVKISEEEIDGSPFLIKSVDRRCLSKDYAPTEDICSSDVEAGRDVCLVIPKDDSLPHGSEPQVEVRGPEGPCEMKLIDQVESSYGLNFTPSVPGDYLIHVRKDKDSEAEIESSPYKIRAIEKQPDSLRVTVPDDFQPLFANPAPLYCLLRFDINTANAGYGTLKIRQSGEGKATISVTQKNEHIYTCNLIPTRKGSCQIDITWNDEGIRGSPFHLTFIPTPTDRTPDINTDIYLVENYNKPTQSQKAVPPSEETVESVIGNAVLVKVTVSDELKDREFSATAVGKDTGPTNVKVTKVNSNVHEVLLYPDKQDVYTVTAKSGDIEVPRSPFVVKYDEPSRPDKCTVHDQPEYVYVNHPIHFVVDAKEAGSGALSIKASVPESEQDVSRPELKIEDNKDGTFGVDYIPSTIGKHSFDILWSGQVIPDSPVNVDVRDEGMNLSGLIEDFIPKDLPEPKPLIIEERIDAVPATEVEGGNPAAFPVPEEPPITVDRRPNPITIIVGKALKLKVKPKDETQRQGTLKARAQGETTGPGVVKTSQHDDGVFEVYFNPPEPDYYVVDVKLNDKNVPQSPFHVLYLPAPEKEPTVEGPAKEEIQAVFVPDKPIDYNIDLSGVSSGTLSAKCRGEESGPVPVTCEPISPDSKKYRVTFVPPRPDLYHLSVFFNDKEMKGSPYEIDLRKKVEDLEPAVEGPAREEIQAVFVPDKPIDYSIDLSSFPSGTLSAKCQGEESGPVPVTYEPISSDSKKYRVAFVPPQPDLYHLSVFFNDREVKGSPYEIDLRRKVEEPVDSAHIQRAIEVYTAPGDDQFTPADKEGTPISDTSEHAHTVEDVPTEEFTVFIGTPLVVKVHAKTDEQRNGELTGTAIGDSVGHRDISAFKRDDTHIVRFDPTEPDRYTIDVKINDESVPRSPFRVNYIMPPTDATKCKLIGVKAIGDFVEVGKDVNLQVDAKQAGPGNLEVSAERPAEEEVASMLSATPSQKEWGYYDVDYIPQSHGKHSLTLKWADQTIPQSPVEIMAVDPNKTEVVPNGKQASVDIDTDGNLKAHCIHKETNHSYKVKINKLQKGKFRLTFQPKDIGIYFLHVYIKDKELPQSPFIIRYARPAKPEACKVTGLTDRCYLGETVTFKVDTKEAGDGGLKIKTLGPDGKETEGLQLTDDKDGMYSAELTPAVPGMYELQMMWGGKPVPGQPFPLFVRDLSKEELLVWLFDIDRVGDLHSVNFPAEGEVLQDSTDHTMLLRVQARTEEQKKEQLTVTATNEETSEKTSFTVTKQGDDTFEARFIPTVPQTYTIEAQLGSSPVPHTPFKVHYETPKADAGKCVIVGLEKHADKFQTNKPILFQVDTRLAGNGKLNLKAEGVQVKPILEAKASKEDSRIIDVTYTPTAPGTHHVQVLWSGEPVPKSPLTFPVEAIPRFPHGKHIGYDLAVDAKAGDIEAHVIHEDTNSRLKVKISKVSKGKYHFSFSPKKPGLYALHILVKKKDIKQSPIYFLYEGPPNPEACLVKDVPEEWYIHEQGSFTVDATEAGTASLSAKVTPPTRGKGGDIKVINNDDGSYTVEHTPEMLGSHKIALTWAGKAIPNSPVTTSVKKRVPKAKAGLGPYMNIVPVGDRVEVDVVNLDKYASDRKYVTASVRAKVGTDQPEIEYKEGMCAVSFVPTVADDYSLSVKISEEEIDGSPFLIKSVDRPCLSKDYAPTEDICSSDVEAGRDVCLVIPKDDSLPHGSEPQVEVRGPEGPCEMKLIDQVESSYGLNFTPSVPGDYLIHVRKDKDSEADIESSPYKIRAIEKQPDSLRVTVPDNFQPLFANPAPLYCLLRFDINTANAGYGTLKIRQSGEGKATISVTQKNEHIYTCNLIPTRKGSCQIDITWNDEGIRGSPFHLTFIPTPTDRTPDINTDIYLVENYNKPTQSQTTVPPSEETVESVIGNAVLVKVTVSEELKDREFSATAVGKDTGPTNVKVTKVNSNVHEVLLYPDKQDVYTVTAKSGDTEVPRSPFVVKYDEPSRPDKCTVHDQPEYVYFNHPIHFVVDTKEAGSGALSIKASVPKSEQDVSRPELKIEDNKDGTFGVDYIPNTIGKHSFDILWSGQVIPDSPVNVDVRDEGMNLSGLIEDFIPKELPVPVEEIQEEVQATEVEGGNPAVFPLPVPEEPPISVERRPNPITIIVGKALKLKVKPKDEIQRQGTLKARVQGETTGPGVVKTSQHDDGVFEVYFNPPEPDYYVVDVKLNNENVPQSPFHVLYLPAPEKEPTVEGPAKEEIQAVFVPDKPIDYNIDLSGVSSGTLSAKCRGEESGPVPVTCEPISPDSKKYRVTFVPPRPDLYHLSVFFNDKEMKGSPYEIDLRKKVEDLEPAVEGPAREEIQAVFVPDKPIDYSIDLSSFPSGNLTAKCQGEESGPVPVTYEPISSDSKKYRVAFVPPQPDLYHLSVFFNDREVKGSPYEIDLRRKVEEPVDSAHIQRAIEVYTAPEDDQFTPADKEGTPISETSEHAHTVEDVPTEEFTVFIGTPLVVKVHAKTDEQRNGELTGTAIGDSVGYRDISAFKRDDTHIVRFDPTEPDRYTIDVKINDESLPRSPFRVNYIMPPTDATKCKLIGVKAIGNFVEVGKDVNLQVDAKQAGPGNLEVSAERPAEEEVASMLSATPSQKEWGYYDVVYIPQSHGKHSLNLKWADQTIPQSPVEIMAVDPDKTEVVPDAGQCVIVGLENHPDKFQVDKPILFQVDTRLAGNGKLNLKAEGVEVKPILEAKSSKEDSRIIDVTYTPTAPGTHHVQVLWSGEPVPKSPLTFPVEAIPRFPHGQPIGYDLAVDAKAGDIEAHVIHEDTNSRLKVKISKVSKGKYHFSFSPKKPGLYALHILVKKKDIKQSPIYFLYEGPPNPEACLVKDVPEEWYIHEQGSFTVGATKAGTASLSAKVTPPTRGKGGDIKVINNDDGTYTVEHTPEVLGSHKIALTWAGKAIPNSPVTTSVKKRVPKAKAGLGPYTNIVPVGDCVEVDVVNLDKYASDRKYVTASAQAKVGTDQPEIKYKEGTCAVSFVPTVADDYSLSVKISEEEIDGSPFLIKSVDRPCLSKDYAPTEDICSSDVEAGRDVCLVIPKDDSLPHGSEPQVEVRGPEGPCEMKLIDQVESSYGLNFTPSVPGDYLIHVRKDKDSEAEIESSPYKIRAVKKEPDAHKVIIPDSFHSLFVDPVPLGSSLKFDINTADASYGTLKIRQSGEGKASIDVTQKNENVYTCSVAPTERGRCQIDIQWNDESIRGGPFRLMFVPATGINLEGETFMVGTQNRFTVDRRSVLEGHLEIHCSDSEAADISIMPAKDGLEFYCIITVKKEGNYQIIVKYNGYNIAGSPFNVHFLKPASANMGFSLKAEGAETSDVSATIQNSLTLEQLPVNLSDLFSGNYALEFVPVKGLEYLVTIKCRVKVKTEEKVVAGSPFALRYERVAGDASKCRAEGQGLTKAIAGEWSSFFVYTEGAGSGELSVDIAGDVFGDEEAIVSAISPTEFEVRYILRQKGSYQISVTWDGQDIPGSAFQITCSAPEPDTNFSEAVFPTNVTFGEPIAFTLTPSSSTVDINDIAVQARSKSKVIGLIPGTVTPAGGSFHCSIDIAHPGKYLIEVRNKSIPLPGTPFIVKVSQPPKPENVQASGPGLQDGFVGQEGSFTIETEEAGSGTMSLNVEGPKGGFKINLDRHPANDRTILASYSPQHTGVYVISIKWAGVEIPGSPFQVNIREEGGTAHH